MKTILLNFFGISILLSGVIASIVWFLIKTVKFVPTGMDFFQETSIGHVLSVGMCTAVAAMVVGGVLKLTYQNRSKILRAIINSY